MPQKITPALTVRAETAPTVRLRFALLMLSCLLLWLRHSSRQLLCPASSFVQSSFITLHYVTLTILCARSLCLGHRSFAHPAHITTNFIHFQRKFAPLHFVSFRPLSLSKLQATRCPCCARLRCRPGCGNVMLFAPPLVG